jgi:hypothetical protein
MRHIIKKILKEELKKKVYPVNWDLIDFENGEVKCYHYSSKSFEDVVKVSGVRGKHSKEEFSTWGRSRSFFYLTEGGIYFDRGVGNLYKYVSYVPVNEIYDITSNSNNYDMSMGWDSLYQQTSVDGYSAWVYNLGGKSNVPILVSFKPVPISEKYEKTLSGSYRIVGEDLKDVVVGNINKEGEDLLVLQRSDRPVNVGNLYGIYPKDIDEKYRYESPIYDYQIRDIEFKDEFKRKYID